MSSCYSRQQLVLNLKLKKNSQSAHDLVNEMISHQTGFRGTCLFIFMRLDQCDINNTLRVERDKPELWVKGHLLL